MTETAPGMDSKQDVHDLKGSYTSSPEVAQDVTFMNIAIKLANNADEKCKSAFRVGAILVDARGTILSTGYSRQKGEHDHAEEVCLREAKELLYILPSRKVLTLYTTMEPCGARLSVGRCSCVDLILKYKHLIQRVVIGCYEPSIFIEKPQGAKLLHEAGIEVTVVNSLNTMCQELNTEVYLFIATQKRRVKRVVEAFAKGEFIVIADDAQREDEGDLVLAAKFATPEKMEYMRKFCSGIICVAMTGERCDELKLPLMVAQNNEHMGTAFTVSVDMQGTTTGVSGSDRSLTVTSLANKETKAEQLKRPGHIFPLRARKGGVLVREGHTEASVDLAILAAIDPPVAVICELVAPGTDGKMMTAQQSLLFAKKVGFESISVDDLKTVMRIRKGS